MYVTPDSIMNEYRREIQHTSLDSNRCNILISTGSTTDTSSQAQYCTGIVSYIIIAVAGYVWPGPWVRAPPPLKAYA